MNRRYTWLPHSIFGCACAIALASCGGNRTEAARRLNIHRQLLYEKMRRYGLDLSGSRTGGVVEPDDPTP